MTAAHASLPQLDETALHTRRRDLVSSALMAAMVVALDMGPAIAKRAFDATDFEVALITAGQCLGLLSSFFVANLAERFGKTSLVFWPELVARLAIAAVFFVQPGFALAFVLLHMAANTFQHLTMPARVTVYRLNYPEIARGRIVGRNRQVQLGISAVLALGMSVTLDWSDGRDELVRLLGDAPFDAAQTLRCVFPALAGLGLVGSFVFRSIRVREVAPDENGSQSFAQTARRMWSVLRHDATFRRYEIFFMVFGFANIMSLPLTRIHAVDELGADYFDLALIDVVILKGSMALTLVYWGRRIDTHSPMRVRGMLNVILALDFIIFALAPSIGWIFVGRVFRGIAIGGGSLVWMLGSLHYARSKKDVPVYIAIHTILTGVRWGLAPFLGVLLKSSFSDNARPIFALSATIMLGTALLMIRESRHDPPRAT